MIKIENTMVTGWEPAIRGARNPMNSWDKSDSLIDNKYCDTIDDIFGETVFSDEDSDFGYYTYDGPEEKEHLYSWAMNDSKHPEFVNFYDRICIGPNDLKLLTNLANAGSDEAKFRRMIVVYVDITAPMYWWKEADTYKVGTVRNSCSTMHKIHAKEFTLEDFSTEHLFKIEDSDIPGIEKIYGVPVYPFDKVKGVYAAPFEFYNHLIAFLNHLRKVYLVTKDKRNWWQMIQLLPSSYNQRATLMLNYEVLANMYHARRNHKLDEWREFCAWIETLPYAKELIIGFQMRTDIYKPTVLSKDLITVNVCEEKDDLIELRRGVPALYLGDGINYCQARILVGDGQYIKGMCVYKDDMPEDCDVIVNTRDKDTVFKDLDYRCAFSRYSNQPLKQRFYKNPDTGEFEISPINYISNDGDWDEWSRSLPTTFLSKEKEQELIKEADEHLRKGGVDIPEEEENKS